MKEEIRLPKSILDKAVKSGNEFGWRQSDFLDVVETARQLKMAIVGGQVQYPLPDGTCELYWLSYDPTTRKQNETWSDYCNRTASECTVKFLNLTSKTDFDKEAIDGFDFLKNKKATGTNISDFLTFMLYFDDSETDLINTSDFLSYNELQNAIESDATDNNFKTAANFLLNAVTDYPTFNLKEPTDLVAALRQSINNKLTFDNLDKYLKSLRPDKDAWTMEAINSLLEMFDFERKNIFDKTIELDTIIRKLTQHYSQ
jgi:hypothetical protein